MQDAVSGDGGAFRAVGEIAAAHRRGLLLDRLAALLSVVGDFDRAAVQELLCGWLDETGAGVPSPAFGPLRDEAAFWADCAYPAEIEAFVAAGLRRIERRQFAEGARKRILAEMWKSLTPQDRVAFLRSVDPNGRFAA